MSIQGKVGYLRGTAPLNKNWHVLHYLKIVNTFSKDASYSKLSKELKNKKAH